MDKEKILKKNITVPAGYSAGFARITINPEPGTSLGGYGGAQNRLCQEIVDDIMFTCTALSDGKSIILLFTCDVLNIRNTMADTLCAKMEEEYGIPKDNIIFNATHTHSAPAAHFPKLPGMEAYLVRFWEGIFKIAEEAIRDLAPAEMFASRIEAEGMSHVRRYVSRKKGAEYLGNWPGYVEPEEGRHETFPDREMQVLRFGREEKKDILLCNWQCHPCSTRMAGERGTLVTSDWVGPFRKWVEESGEYLFAYHQGAGGNLVSVSAILGENTNTEYRRKGRELAWYLKRALESEKEMEWGPFRATRREFTATYKPEKREELKKETEDLYVSALCIGNVAFATVPCEYHDSCGRFVKQGSPFSMTFFLGYTNGCFSYIPASFAWENGGYEVNSCMFERGTAEKISIRLLNMLDEIAE